MSWEHEDGVLTRRFAGESVTITGPDLRGWWTVNGRSGRCGETWCLSCRCAVTDIVSAIALAVEWMRDAGIIPAVPPRADWPDAGGEPVVHGLLEWMEREHIHPSVRRGVLERVADGMERYGRPLLPHGGRDPIADLREELADACQYAWRAQVCGRHDDLATLAPYLRPLLVLLNEPVVPRPQAERHVVAMEPVQERGGPIYGCPTCGTSGIALAYGQDSLVCEACGDDVEVVGRRVPLAEGEA